MDTIDVPDATVGGVLDWVDQADSPAGRLERCELAITVEKAGKARGTLLQSLASLRATLTDSAPPADAAPAPADSTSDGPAPSADVQRTAEELADGRAAGEPKLCGEHFPAGWRSDVITRTEAAIGVRQPSVTCKHGTYTRPAE